MRITALEISPYMGWKKNCGARGDSLLILSPLGLLSRKPHFKICRRFKWRERHGEIGGRLEICSIIFLSEYSNLK
jgi:hypothetical protein